MSCSQWDMSCGADRNRKRSDPDKKIYAIKRDRINFVCRNDGCNNPVNDGLQMRIAKVGNTLYYFCGEKCYLAWLKRGVFRAICSRS